MRIIREHDDALRQFMFMSVERDIINLIKEISNVKDHCNYIKIIHHGENRQYVLSVESLLYVGIGHDTTMKFSLCYAKENVYVLQGFPNLSTTIDFETLDEIKIFINKWLKEIEKLTEKIFVDVVEQNKKFK